MYNYIKYGLVWFSIMLPACAPLPQTLKPVAIQNQQNLTALSRNVYVLLALYEPLLQASTNALIYQHIGRTQAEMITVVGAPTASPPSAEQTWVALFEKASKDTTAKREKFLERYHLVRSAVERGVSDSDLNHLKYTEGWIYQAATDSNFTPKRAHELLKTLSDLRKNNTGNNSNYFQEVERQLSPYDPLLQFRREVADSAQVLLNGLKQEVTAQLTTAAIHGQAIAGSAENTLDVEKTLTAVTTVVNNDQLKEVLSKASEKYLKNPSFKDAVINLLLNRFTEFFK